MKANNIFTFVSVRPPKALARKPTLLREDKLGSDLVDEYKRRLAEAGGKDGGAVRRKMGTEIAQARDYFTQNGEWTRLAIILEPLERLIREGRPIAGFKEQAQDQLRGVLRDDLDLEAYLASDVFKRLIDLVWMGYYANLLNPERYPDERDLANRWLRVLRVLAAARKDSEYAIVIDAFENLRLEVPAELFDSDFQPPKAPDAPKDETEPRRLDMVQKLKEYAHARDALERLSKEKLGEFLKVKYPKPAESQIHSRRLEEVSQTLHDIQSELRFIRRDDKPPEAEPAPAVEDRSSSAGSGTELLEKAPWRLARSDFAKEPETMRIIEELGLDPDSTLVPDLVYAVEQRMAILEADIGELTRVRTVAGFGRHLVTISRIR